MFEDFAYWAKCHGIKLSTEQYLREEERKKPLFSPRKKPVTRPNVASKLRLDCLFCDKDNPENHRIIFENELFYARWDNFPVTRGHAEIVPKRHIVSLFDLTEKEIIEMFDLLRKAKKFIERKYHPDGYNIGINEGEAAGRTVHHLHIHIIPRYFGDVPNPRGGIRNIIPEKGNYKD